MRELPHRAAIMNIACREVISSHDEMAAEHVIISSAISVTETRRRAVQVSADMGVRYIHRNPDIIAQNRSILYQGHDL